MYKQHFFEGCVGFCRPCLESKCCTYHRVSVDHDMYTTSLPFRGLKRIRTRFPAHHLPKNNPLCCRCLWVPPWVIHWFFGGRFGWDFHFRCSSRSSATLFKEQAWGTHKKVKTHIYSRARKFINLKPGRFEMKQRTEVRRAKSCCGLG